MSKTTDLGIYLKSNKTFYYLEYGENYVQNTLDRIRKTLVQRNLINALPDNNSRDAQYEVISYKQAHDNSLEMQPIYISKHVQNLVEALEKKSTAGGSFK
jgi:hypothetical protein